MTQQQREAIADMLRSYRMPGRLAPTPSTSTPG
jgi:hypothetical protein